MQLISTLKGSGWIHGAPARKTEARYAIGVWRTAEGAVFGHGEITGDADAMIELPWRPVSLVLADGQAIDVTVIGPGTGSGTAQIYVPGAAPPADQIVA